MQGLFIFRDWTFRPGGIMRRLLVVLLASSVLLNAACARPQDRQPAVAGQFYPAEKERLTAMLQELFAGAISAKGKSAPIALIVPHAGYVYSGGVAASGYSRIAPDAAFENVFILGPSHHVGFEGAAVYTQGDFITPLGRVQYAGLDDRARASLGDTAPHIRCR